MNYFEFFNLPVSFKIDEKKLKQRFYAYSKAYHPDFFTLDPDEKQAEILELSTLNNQAFQALSNPDRRMKYVLELKGVLLEEGNNELPGGFLAEIMEINEAMMELEFGFDQIVYDQAKASVQQLEKQLSDGVNKQLECDDVNALSAGEIDAVKDFYLKKRYLLRILENLDRFAPASKEG